MKPSSTNCSAALINWTASGNKVRSSAITSSLTQSVPSAFPGQLRVQHRLGRAAAVGRVRQRADAQPVQQVKNAGAAFGVDAAHRDRGQLGARRDERLLEHAEVRRTAGAHDQLRAELATGDRQFRFSPPCAAITTSTRAPSLGAASHSERGITTQLTASAMPLSSKPMPSSSAATVVCSATSTASSLMLTNIGVPPAAPPLTI